MQNNHEGNGGIVMNVRISPVLKNNVLSCHDKSTTVHRICLDESYPFLLKNILCTEYVPPAGMLCMLACDGCEKLLGDDLVIKMAMSISITCRGQ